MGITKRVVGLLLLAAAVAAAVLYLRRGPASAQSGTIPGLVTLAPADASYLLYADLSALRSSEFLSQLLALAPAPKTDREYTEFVQATGFDYTRDLDRVVLAIRPGSPAVLTLALAEGHFDREKISAYALRSGKAERENGAEVFLVPGATPGKTIAMAFLHGNRVALADGPGGVAALRALMLPGGPNTFEPAMRERIARVAGSALFVVGQVGSVPENLSLGGLRSDQFANLVRSLRWFNLAARPDGDRLNVVAEGECDTAENARQLAGTLDGLRLLGQAALADPKTRQQLQPLAVRWLEVLVRLAEVSRHEQRVRLTVALTPEMFHPLRGAAAGKGPSANKHKR